MVLKPDENAAYLVPWYSEPTAQIIHDAYYLDDTEVTLKCNENLKPISSVTDKRDIEKACNKTTKKNKEHVCSLLT